MLILLITSIIASIAFFTSFCIFTKLNKENTSKISKTMKRITVTAGILCLIHILVILITMYGAQQRGFENSIIHANLFETIYQNQRNHIVNLEYIPENNDIVIYVRYGCPSCELFYDELNYIQENNEDIYFISTRTITGIDLMQAYPTTIVPSAILIGSDLEYIPLFIEDEFGNITFNQTGFDELIEQRILQINYPI